MINFVIPTFFPFPLRRSPCDVDGLERHNQKLIQFRTIARKSEPRFLVSWKNHKNTRVDTCPVRSGM